MQIVINTNTCFFKITYPVLSDNFRIFRIYAWDSTVVFNSENTPYINLNISTPVLRGHSHGLKVKFACTGIVYLHAKEDARLHANP